MEKDILHVLDFNLCVPTSIEFFQILSKLFELNEIQINFGKYFLESVLIDYDMIYFSPSIIAFSSIYIIMKFFKLKHYKYLFRIYSLINSEKLEKIIKDCGRKMCFLVKNLSESNLNSIKEKY